MKPNSLISHATPVSVCATLILITAGFGFSTTQARERFEFTSYKDIDQLFEQLNYTPETWQAGIREVPRVYLTTIHSRWRDQFSQEISVTHKKRLFFRALAPLVLRSNELIIDDRSRLEELDATLASESHPTDDDLLWLHELALRYRVINEISDSITDTEMAELRRRVDIVPLSIALSQSAEESGWGTSRFAAVGNSLFGQWSWGKGITPQEQRTSEKGDYRIAAFESPLDSVKGYSINLNTHRAYRELRASRAGLRETGKPVRGADLVDMLNRYSERGDAYVESLKTIMRVNRLDAADDAYLADGPEIELIPVDSYSSSAACLESERLKATQAPADSSC